MLFSSDNKFTMTINGTSYQDCWESVDVTRSMEDFCGSIAVKTVDFFEEFPELWNINVDDTYIISLDNQVVSTGYIDEVNKSYSSNDHTIEFMGRDKISDLVDCCYFSDNDIVSWKKGTTILQIIKNLCEPFEITVTFDPMVSTAINNTLSADFVVDQGQSVFEEINKLCLKIGILALSDVYGNLFLTRSSSVLTTTDILGENNVLSSEFNLSHVDRFSKYIVRCQGNNEDEFASLFDYIDVPPGIANDYMVKRNRPLVLMMDGVGNYGTALQLAIYESRIRQGNSRIVTYEVEGWTEVTSGKLWMPNSLVLISDSKLYITDSMLLESVNYTYSTNQGFVSTLTFVHPFKYSIQPITTAEKEAGNFNDLLQAARARTLARQASGQ